MKIRDSCGCSIEGITEEDFKKFKNAGWMTEEDYLKLHPEEKE